MDVQRVANGKNHPIRIGEHVIIPEAQDSITARFEPARARRVADLVLGVLPSVDFDDEAGLGTEKVRNIRANRLLAPKPCTVELFPP